ncbi:DUF3396 domain-containing protein [Mesorhizobium sp. B2-2-3]|uniref:type VI immunity family protein n=1 Tax=Mesorhizobium sp. B2-2-3 TaxID=2589963 RepID=UPI001127AA5E|nr:type VI immunity family protein [Mesorhizobium sp. B2-2-3]TPM48428.1 DUF3396 domain-containing protein [Mesorhizobium sp. B2-2-3]
MSEASWESLRHWQETSIQDDEGQTGICFGLAVTMYFNSGHTKEQRIAALECFNEYDDMIGKLLRWHSVGAESGRMSPVTKLQSRDMSPYLLSALWETDDARDHAWAFCWHGGKRPYDASPIKIFGLGSPQAKAELKGFQSFLQVSFPVLWFDNRVEEFILMIERWCQRLQPAHGYGGITLLESPDSGLAHKFAPDIAGFASRYPGLEVDVPIAHEFATRNGIKGGNWLTVLATEFVEKLGGIGEVREHLGEPFVVLPYSKGAIVIAGSTPEVGDRNRNQDTPLYRRLANILRPIRISHHARLYTRGLFAEEGPFEAWLARFDE